MRRSYRREVAEIPTTFRNALNSSIARSLIRALRHDGPTVFVGSGGALAAAQFAADLHTYATGHLATAMTPLQFAAAKLNSQSGLVLFSARGSNPDAALTIRAAKSRDMSHIGLLTARPRHELPKLLASDFVRVASLNSPPDGFLATNSLIAMAVGICTAFGFTLPDSLPAFNTNYRAPKGSVLVVSGPGTAAVGVDIEARLAETGIAQVQLADFRNIAHGRHVGLGRHASSTTVIAIVDNRAIEVASRTLSELPSKIDVIELKSPLDWPLSVLDLLVASVKVVEIAGNECGIDPGRPGVKPFGRRLYHLAIENSIATDKPDPVEQKLPSRGVESKIWDTYRNSLAHWLEELRRADITGLVLDYDGTIVDTAGRFDPPVEEIRSEIVRLLELGLIVGFATGRGKSFHQTTKRWMPERFWRKIPVGLYNGTQILRLADQPLGAEECGEHLKEIADRIGEFAEVIGLEVERRRTQVTVSGSSLEMSGDQIAHWIRPLLARTSESKVKMVISGHSVDILDSAAGKQDLISQVLGQSQGSVIAIGDQGQPGGNDFELLAAVKSSLSVDRCSGDPTRCWNLDRRNEKRTGTLGSISSGVTASGRRNSLHMEGQLRDELAGRLLDELLDWTAQEQANWMAELRQLASYKFDSYEGFPAGVRFFESLVRWLRQFETVSDRRRLIEFVREGKVFLSRQELSHAIACVYPDFIKRDLIDQVSTTLGFSRYQVKRIVESDEFRNPASKNAVFGSERWGKTRHTSPIKSRTLARTVLVGA